MLATLTDGGEGRGGEGGEEWGREGRGEEGGGGGHDQVRMHTDSTPAA